MTEKIWTAEFHGHRIRAINRLSWLPPRTSEALEIDGVMVHDAPGSFLRSTATHLSRHILGGVERTVEARFANEVGGLGVGCQIFVDGSMIGGSKAIMFPDPAETERILGKGFLHYFLTYGLPRFGLFFAILMSLTSFSLSPTAAVWTFVFHALWFGGFMSWWLWRGLVDAARARVRFRSEAGTV